MSTRTIQLPAGTSHPEMINLPLSGGWAGLVRVRIATWGADATLHEWLFINPNMPNNQTGYRRTAMSSANNYYNSTLVKDQEASKWLAQGESLMKLTYTATNPISVCIETTRSIRPAPYADLPATKWNITNATPWTGANTAGGNATEKAAGRAGQLNGLVYWKKTTP